MIAVVPGGAEYPLMADPAMLRETKRAVAETAVGISDLEIAMLKPDTEVASLLPLPEAGAEVGAKHVSIAGYGPDEPRLIATVDRSNSRIDDMARIPSGAMNDRQLCNAPREKPTTTEGLLHAARAKRMFPGEGGIDLVSLIRAIPADVPITSEIQAAELACTVGPLERARRAVARTHESLARAAAEQVA